MVANKGDKLVKIDNYRTEVGEVCLRAEGEIRKHLSDCGHD